MEIADILRRYEELLAAGRTADAGRYLEDEAEKAEANGDGLKAASCRNELEGFWRVCGDKAKSFASAEKALSLLEQNGLKDSIEYATSLLNYATAKSAFGYVKEAMEIYARVESCYASLPRDDYRVASLYNNMAQALLRGGDAAGAEEKFKSSLAMLEDMPGAEAEIATCCTNIAFALLARRNVGAARPYLDRAEDIFRTLPDDPHADAALSCRGQLEYINKRYAQALEAFAALAANTERRYGRNMRYASACRNCAKVCETSGDMAGAAHWRELAATASR